MSFELTTQPEENTPTLDNLQERTLDIKKEIDQLANGDTRVIADRILGKLNDLLDALDPAKLANMRGKEIMSAIKESVETINILIGKKDNSNNVIVNIINNNEKPVMVGVITQAP